MGLCLVASSSGGPPCPPVLEQINLIAKAFRLVGPVIRACACERRVCEERALRFFMGLQPCSFFEPVLARVLLGSDVLIHLA